MAFLKDHIYVHNTHILQDDIGVATSTVHVQGESKERVVDTTMHSTKKL